MTITVGTRDTTAQLSSLATSLNQVKMTVLQCRYTGNTLSGFTDGDFQRVDLVTGAVVNPAVEAYTYDMPNRNIDDLIDSTENLLKFNPAVGTGVDFRIIFDFSSKETNKSYLAVWKLKLPDTAPVTFVQNIDVPLKKKDTLGLNIPFNAVSISTINNIDNGLEVYLAIQKSDESDSGDATTTVVSLSSITATHLAAQV